MEYFYGAGTLDEYISDLLSTKMNLIQAVEADVVPDASILGALEARLRSLSPALMQENRLASVDPAARLAELTKLLPKAIAASEEAENPSFWEFTPAGIPQRATG